MVYWISHPVQLPESAPEALKDASLGWTKPGFNVAVPEDRFDTNIRTSDTKVGEPQPRKRKRTAEENVNPTTNYNASSHPATAQQHASLPEPDVSLAAALQRMYPRRERYHVKTSHIVRPDQWHPVDRTTQDYHPSMKQPLTRNIGWDDHGITRQTGGKVPHETVLDFLVDVMRNKHWRGDVTTADLHSHRLTWPRLRFYELTKMIAENPFLLRLAQMLEGRFTAAAAAAGKLDYVPAVYVQGTTNQAVCIEPRYIAAIFIHALGRDNESPCSLCAGNWNNSEEAGDDTRPFASCKSLSALGLPERLRACSNHFWFASITDCSCVDMTAPLHPDEHYEYLWTCFARNASNYVHLQDTLG